MKWLLSMLLFLALFIFTVYVLLFTSIGNALTAPIIERQLCRNLHMPVSLTTFILRFDHFQLAVDDRGGSNHVEAEGNFSLPKQRLNGRYTIGLHDLSTLQPLTQQPLQGALMSHGFIKGAFRSLDLTGVSDIAQSQTQYRMRLINFAPATITASIEEVQIAKLLAMGVQPRYGDGELFVDLNLSRMHPGATEGNIRLKVRNGRINRDVTARFFALPRFQGASFALNATTTIQNSHALSNLTLASTLLSLKANPIHYDLDTGTVTAHYKTKVPDLSGLNFLSKKPLRGEATVQGDLHYNKTLLLHGQSQSFGGNIIATVEDRKLHADLQEVNTLKVLDALGYPAMFDAAMNGSVDYAFGTGRGRLRATLLQGRFTRNNAFDLARQYAGIDLYVERFKGTTEARIDKAMINADLTLRSNHTLLKSEGARINNSTNRIDAKLHLDANHNPLDLHLKGDLNHPAVSVDASELIQRETGKQIQRLFNNIFK